MTESATVATETINQYVLTAAQYRWERFWTYVAMIGMGALLAIALLAL